MQPKKTSKKYQIKDVKLEKIELEKNPVEKKNQFKPS